MNSQTSQTSQTSQAAIFKYSFQIAIRASVETVWSNLAASINAWWMTDFRVFGANSEVSLEMKTGGSLIERGQDGSSLEWYRVQMCVPEKSLLLVGFLAPDWGGPTLSMLSLALQASEEGCVLTVSDALSGNTSAQSAQSAEDGWKLLFDQGFRAHVESLND